jgi:hypothetical protein
MEAFRKTVTRRHWLGIAYTVLVAVLTSAQRFMDFNTLIPDYVLDFSLGLFTGAEVLVIYFVVRYSKALRDPALLETLYIAETDERNAFIRAKTGGMAVNVIIGGLICAALAAGIFSETAFIALAASAAFAALVRGSFKAYYRKKV